MARKKNRKWLRICGVVVLIIVVIVGVVIWQQKTNETTKDNLESKEIFEKNDQDENAESEDSQAGDENFAEEEVKKKQVVQYEGGDPNSTGELTGTITYADVSNGKLVIRVSIDQYLTNGDCKLTLSKNGATVYSDTANVISDVSTATCEGFDVSVGGLGGGKIEININVSSDGKTGVIRGETNI